MRKGNYAICQSCGKKANYTECSQRCAPPQVAHWKGIGAIDYYHFCSFGCLQRWVDTQVPRVPETFLKAFE